MDQVELTTLIENSAAETRRHVDIAAEETRKDARHVAEIIGRIIGVRS